MADVGQNPAVAMFARHHVGEQPCLDAAFGDRRSRSIGTNHMYCAILVLITFECVVQLFPERLGPVSFTLPNRQYAPTRARQRSLCLLVPKDVTVEFLAPEHGASFRCGGLCATCMTVPEAAVDKDRGSMFREDDIGRARQAAPVEPEPQSQPMQKPTNHQFGPGVGLPHGAHDPASRSVYGSVWR